MHTRNANGQPIKTAQPTHPPQTKPNTRRRPCNPPHQNLKGPSVKVKPHDPIPQQFLPAPHRHPPPDDAPLSHVQGHRRAQGHLHPLMAVGAVQGELLQQAARRERFRQVACLTAFLTCQPRLRKEGLVGRRGGSWVGRRTGLRRARFRHCCCWMVRRGWTRRKRSGGSGRGWRGGWRGRSG